VPAARMAAINLIGGVGLAAASEFSFMDAHCMMVDAAIKKRMEICKKDEDGEHWEQREEEDLAFPCRPVFCNELGREVESHIVDHDDCGCTWGCFWSLESLCHRVGRCKGPNMDTNNDMMWPQNDNERRQIKMRF
jgi:hypothetical protein